MLFDDTVSQVSKNTSTIIAQKSNHIRDNSDFGPIGGSMKGKGSRQSSNRQRNVVSTRLTPKSSYGAGGGKGIPHDGSSERIEDSSYRAGSKQ